MTPIEKAKELINKHLYLHGGDGLGITNGDVYLAVLDAVCEALTIPDVVGRSKQLNCLGENYAKGIERCSEWCGEDICQKPSN